MEFEKDIKERMLAMNSNPPPKRGGTEPPPPKSFSDRFKQSNSYTWYVFNTATFFIAIDLISSTYYIHEEYQEDCGGIRDVLYIVIAFHALNLLVALINTLKLENYLLGPNIMFVYGLIQTGLFIYMQMVYFKAQMKTECLTEAPVLYVFLMSQIILIWICSAIIVCHFFRRFFQYEDWEDGTKPVKPKKPKTPKTPKNPKPKPADDEMEPAAPEEDEEEPADPEPEEPADDGSEGDDFDGHDICDIHDIEVVIPNINGPVFTDREFPANRSTI